MKANCATLKKNYNSEMISANPKIVVNLSHEDYLRWLSARNPNFWAHQRSLMGSCWSQTKAHLRILLKKTSIEDNDDAKRCLQLVLLLT